MDTLILSELVEQLEYGLFGEFGCGCSCGKKHLEDGIDLKAIAKYIIEVLGYAKPEDFARVLAVQLKHELFSATGFEKAIQKTIQEFRDYSKPNK